LTDFRKGSMARQTPISRKSAIARIIQPFQDFIRLESAGGLILLFCTVVAILLANSPLRDHFAGLWQTEISIGVDGAHITKSLLHWINDGLMCIFFFVVGLEIKRELIVGELASLKRAALPAVAALGGMIAPALIYIAFNAGTSNVHGWGVPVATDIAFSLGVLAVLGSRVSHRLKIFLTAFAIVDDLGAVLVIAIFYGTHIQWFFLAAAAVVFLLLLSANLGGIHRPPAYLILGTLLWLTLLESGIHATVAGVLLALTIPVRPQMDSPKFIEKVRSLLRQFEKETTNTRDRILLQHQQSIVQTIEISCQKIETPLQRFEHKFHPWVTYGIMPLFAFANAGVSIGGNLGSILSTPVALGIIAGLIVGKQIGITVFSWIAVRLNVAALPAGTGWMQIYGVSWLGGIGFTMSLFIANLAFADEQTLNIAKAAVLGASTIAGCLGWLVLSLAASRISNKNQIVEPKE
jgi:NhaA family Na+:H+ antiporter